MRRTAAAGLALIMLLGAYVAAQIGPAETRNPEPSFVAVDLYVDSGNTGLAAYQIHFRSETGGIRITGIEGGEHERFAEPPFYDSRAIQNDRVIVGAFTTAAAEALPTGRTRVARVHLMVEAGAAPRFAAELQAVAGFDGRAIDANAQLEERASE